MKQGKLLELGTQQLRLESGKVIKHFSKDLLLEALKHRRLAQIGAEHGFRMPKLIAQDVERSTLTYEFIDELTSSRQHFLDYTLRGPDATRDAVQEALFTQIGQTLAVIHRRLDIQPVAVWRAPPVFDRVVRAFTGNDTAALLEHTPQAELHGDFGFSNVCHTLPEPLRLIMIDPSPNSYSSFACNERASVYLDIGKFSLCLRGLVPRNSYLRMRRPRAAKLRELFLQGYADESRVAIEMNVLEVVERALLTCKIRHEMRSALARTAAGILLFGLKDGRVIGRIANAK
ncbi:MAG: hypothetical protein KDA51_11580 [Planctomycetales bacterium]|nr:hypothetical protein [Planctomycetales bacterium]